MDLYDRLALATGRSRADIKVRLHRMAYDPPLDSIDKLIKIHLEKDKFFVHYVQNKRNRNGTI